jgi:hypothetical protein
MKSAMSVANLVSYLLLPHQLPCRNRSHRNVPRRRSSPCHLKDPSRVSSSVQIPLLRRDGPVADMHLLILMQRMDSDKPS